MAYDSSTTKISAPVNQHDVQQAIGSGSGDVGTLCQSSAVNKWAKYKPVCSSLIDTVTNQWDALQNFWSSVASWWRGDRTSSQTTRRECGFVIPCVEFSAEYRQQVYYYDDTAASGVYTAPSSIPTGAWERLTLIVKRLIDFVGYRHVGPVVPMQMQWPASPIVLTQNDAGFSVALQINNYAGRTNGTNDAMFANDMNELSGAQLCAKLTVLRYEDNVYYDTRTYEVSGGSLSDASGNKSLTIMRKLLQRRAVEIPHTDTVTIEPYLRKVTDGVPRLLSLGCENAQAQTIQVIFPGSSYKMRFMVGELDDASIEAMFTAGFTSNLAGRTIRPVVGDVVDTETTGHWIRIGGIFAKAIINDVYNTGTLTGTFTVRVFVEDLKCDDYNECTIPKVQILSFTVSDSDALQGYGFRGASSSPYYHGDDTMSFADAWNHANANWNFGVGLIPILAPYAGGESWPAGTALNPHNNVVAKFRVTCEIEPVNGHTIFSVPQNGDGSYKKTDPNYNPYTSMLYWKTGYIFDVLEDGQGGYEVVRDPDVCGAVFSLDSGEVSDNLGTASWMPLPQGWGTAGSTWLTE